MKPTIGRIVHFVQKKPSDRGEGLVHLPAMVVAVWGEACVNLQVFTDGSNSEDSLNGCAAPGNVKWITSVGQDETAAQPRTWHWPERETA